MTKDIEAPPERYATQFNLPFARVVDPLDGKPDVRDLTNLLTLGPVHTLYVTDPGLFASERQRQVVYALALHCGVRVIEGENRVTRAARDHEFNQLLMDGTQLFLGLRAHDRATILEQTRSDAHRDKLIADLRASGDSLACIAKQLNEEAILTPRRSGRWHKSAVQRVLRNSTEESA